MDNPPSEEIIINLIKEYDLSNNNKIMTPKIIGEEETFNRLLELQLLIKKESGLKELCK